MVLYKIPLSKITYKNINLITKIPSSKFLYNKSIPYNPNSSPKHKRRILSPKSPNPNPNLFKPNPK